MFRLEMCLQRIIQNCLDMKYTQNIRATTCFFKISVLIEKISLRPWELRLKTFDLTATALIDHALKYACLDKLYFN